MVWCEVCDLLACSPWCVFCSESSESGAVDVNVHVERKKFWRLKSGMGGFKASQAGKREIRTD